MPDRITDEERRAIDEWLAKRKPTWVAPGVSGDAVHKSWHEKGRMMSARVRKARARRIEDARRRLK